MQWNKEEDQKPEFDVQVLGWKTCESCKDGHLHTHNLMASTIPVHGPFLATYISPDEGLVNYRKSKGDNSFDHFLQPQWIPRKPSHWQYIKSPYET